MKKIIFYILLLMPLYGFGQWNNNGDNSTTGNLTVGGAITSTTNYGLIVQPVSGDAIIKRGNLGSLMISSNGGASDVRINYNYGGGSGGITIYDGGVVNNANFKVNTNGHLSVFSSGGNVGIGTTSPLKKMHISGTVDVEQWIEATDDGYASLTLKSNNKQWHWSKRPSTFGDVLQLYHHNGTAWNSPYMTFLTDGKIGIGSTLPMYPPDEVHL